MRLSSFPQSSCPTLLRALSLNNKNCVRFSSTGILTVAIFLVIPARNARPPNGLMALTVYSIDSKKLFARCKWDGHCLYHMLSPRQSSRQMILLYRGIQLMSPRARVTNETTKRSFLMRCLYRKKSVLVGSGCPADG